MIAGLLFALQNTLAAIVCCGLASAAAGSREPWLRAFVALAAFPLVAVGVLLGVDLVASVRPASVLMALLVLAAPAVWVLARTDAGEPERPRNEAPLLPSDGLGLVALGLAGGLLGTWTLKTALLGTGFVWDDLTYHAALPAAWLTSGEIGLVPFTFQTYFPLASEVFSLWFLLPFHADAWASLAVAYWGLLAASSVALLARHLAGAGPAAGLAVALLLGSSVVWNRSNSFGATDLAGSACILAALVFFLPGTARRDGEAARGWLEPVASGLLAGFAVGCKSLYLPAAAILLVGWLRRSGPSRTRDALAFAGCTAVAGAGWYLRNWILTGNPVFPVALGPWDGPLVADAQDATRLVSHLFAAPFDLAQWRDVVVDRSNWPASLAAIAGWGGLSGLARALRRADPGDEDAPGREISWLLVWIGTTLVLLYPLLPFSATANRPDAPLHAGYLRFVILPYAAGVVLFTTHLRDTSSHRHLAGAAAGLAIAAGWKLSAPLSGAFFALALTTMAGREQIARMLRSSADTPVWRTPLLVAAVCIAFAAWTPVKQKLTDENLYTYRAAKGPVGDGWRALATLPDGATVAFFMAEPSEYTQLYPTFGRGFRLSPVPVEADGTRRRLLHETWRDDPRDWWSDWRAPRRAEGPATLSRELADVDYVLTTRWSLGSWPHPHEALAKTATSMYDDGYSALWKLAP